MDDNDRGLVKFTSLAHALFHIYELSIPLFIGMWMSEFGISAALIGTVVGVGYGCIGIGAPVSGVLADRFGSRELILTSVVGMGIGFVIVGLARSVVSLSFAVLLWGIFAGLYHPAGLSLISRTAEARGMVFAYHGAGGNIGTVAGPLATALLLQVADWRFTAIALSVPAFIAMLAGLRIEFEVPTRNGDVAESLLAELRRLVGDSRALFSVTFSLAFLAILLYGTYYRGLLTFLPDMLAESPHLVPATRIGHGIEPAQYVYTALLTVGIAGQYAGGRLTNYLPSTTAFMAIFGILTGLALVFPVARATGIVPLVGVCLALGFFVYATAPIYQVVIAEYAAADIHGLSYGFTYLAMYGIGALGASIAGFVLTHATSSDLFFVLAVIAAIGAGIVAFLHHH